MITAFIGSNYTVTSSLKDGTTGAIRTLTVFNGAAVVQGPTVMTDRGSGRYDYTAASPATAGYYQLLIETPGFETVSDVLLVSADFASQILDEALSGHVTIGTVGEALAAAAGHAGLRVVLDGGPGVPNIPHSSDNQLTTARLRVFATDAAVAAATMGALDGADGELLRLNVDVASYQPGNANASPAILTNMRRSRS